jgi:nucleotide-binding universal stress UspA family protein
MSPTIHSIPGLKRIVVGSDFSEAALHALQLAAALAQLSPLTTEIHVVHVVPPLDLIGETDLLLNCGSAVVIDGAREELEAICVELRKEVSGQVVPYTAFGDVVTELAGIARALDADLIIIGAPPHARWDLLHRRVIARLTRAAPCSVLAARSKETGADAVVEPPCDDCLATQRASAGRSQWCRRHSEHRVHAHLHHGSADHVAPSPWSFSS